MSYFEQIDFTKTGKQLLLDLINYGNRNTMLKILKESDVTFTRPRKLPNDKECNTAIRFLDIKGYKGMELVQDIEYNRMDINQVANHLNFDLILDIYDTDKIKTSHDLLEDLNKSFKVKLTEEDIVLEDIPEENMKYLKGECKPTPYHEESSSYYWPTYRLKISENSIAYYGYLDIELRARRIRIDTAIRKLRFTKSFKPIDPKGLGE